ncbi:f-box only protein 38 [Trichonephila clavipes]|nr:f-box only protein 38 [Trichonephila clavipes]
MKWHCHINPHLLCYAGTDGVEVPELTAMPHLEHLHLYCVRFTKLQPFRAFLATRLKTFVMKHCIGPSLSLRYLSHNCPELCTIINSLELVRVPLPGGLFQRAVEDSYRHNGFINLKVLVISGCKVKKYINTFYLFFINCEYF